MKNSLNDLNNHLFAALERLNDEDLDEAKLKVEVERAQAVIGIGEAIIHNADTQLKAIRMAGEYCGTKLQVPQNILSLAHVEAKNGQ